MYTPATHMDCEQYQDLSQLSWFDNMGQHWGVGEAPSTAISVTATEAVRPITDADSANIPFEDNDYNISDMNNQLYQISRADSIEEIKGLIVTAPMEVVPMRHHEALEVSGIVKTEREDLDVGREEEIIPSTDNPLSLSQEFKVDPAYLLDTPDLLDELGGGDLIDFIISEEPQPLVPTTVPTLSPLLETNIQKPVQPLSESQPLRPKESPKPFRETYLAIPRELTAKGTGDDKKIPKMLILKTPQSDLSTINLKDLPKMSIGESVKKRQRPKRYKDFCNDDNYEDKDDDDDDYYEISTRKSPKRARRISTTSTSSTSTDKYRELRDKNNEASRRSRLNRKEREKDLMKSLSDAEQKNHRLRARSDELEKLVLSLRKILLQIVVSKGTQR